MKVLFVTSESIPFAKTGGLADVSGALPVAMKAKRIDMRLIMPLYKKIDRKRHGIEKLPGRIAIPMPSLDKIEYGEIYKCTYKKMICYFVSNKKYFDREQLYSTPKGDYPDNDERFIFFSRAVLEVAKCVDFKPDIIHCNDWQTGLIPLYLKTIYSLDAFYNMTASVFSVHNVAYQGIL